MMRALSAITETIVIAHLSSPKLGIGWDGSNPMFASRWRRPTAVLSQWRTYLAIKLQIKLDSSAIVRLSPFFASLAG
jgi:hypothetical protein